jgi:hypothetical protein
MWLYIGVFRSVECTGPPACQGLHLVDDSAASIVAAAGVALRVLVGQYRTLGLQYSGTGVVLGGDEVQSLPLPLVLLPQQSGQLRVLEGQPGIQGILTGYTGLRYGRAVRVI